MTPNPHDFDPLLDILYEGVFIVDAEHTIVYANAAAARLFGYERRELLGQPLAVLLPERYRRAHDRQVSRFMSAGRATLMGERPLLQALCKNGREVPVSISLSPIDLQGVRHAVAVVRDASTVRAEIDEATLRAETDVLTGIPNRLGLSRRMRQMLEAAAPKFAVMMLDLVQFKPFNDRYGHAHGDKVLRVVAQRIAAEIRDDDLAARVGGDEFVVLLDDVDDPVLVERQAMRLAGAIAAPLDIDGIVGCLGVSIGAALCPRDGRDEAVLIERADQAMYRAKARGVPFLRHAEVPGSPTGPAVEVG